MQRYKNIVQQGCGRGGGIPKIKILHYDVFHALSALILERLTVRIESLLKFSKTVPLSSLPAWSNSFVCVSLLPAKRIGRSRKTQMKEWPAREQAQRHRFKNNTSDCFNPSNYRSGVPQDSVLSPTLFLLYFNDLLNLTQCPILFNADDTTLHFSTSYNRRPTQQKLSDSRWDVIGCLPFDLSLVSDWDRANLVLFNAAKTKFLQLSTRHNLPDNYPLFFNDTQFPLSSTLNTLDLSFTKNLNWQFHISTHAKSASKN